MINNFDTFKENITCESIASKNENNSIILKDYILLKK